jgi:murein DD-endopeptidase MepM/ murein hydrolase activator NlpD
MPLMENARTRAFGALLLLSVAVVPVVPARGAPPSSDPRVRELQEAIGEASADEAAALRELADIRGRRTELDAVVAGFDGQIRAVEGRIAALQADFDRFSAEAAAREAEAAAAQAQLDEAKRRAEEAAAALYRGENGAEIYAEMLDVDNVQDAFTGSKYLDHLSARRRGEVEALSGLKVQIEQLRQQAAAQRDEARAKQQEAEGERSQLAGLRAEQQQQRSAIVQEESRERALVASIRARKDQFADELASLQAASTAVSQMLATRQRGQQRASSFQVERPVPGAVTGAFGNRVHPILGTTRIHTGVDMTASTGTPVKAGAPGVVAWAGPRGGYGNAVIVDHGNQFATVYAHASAVKVSVGQTVRTGQTVALAGATGMATGPHLHFEVRILGVPVNPVAYM